MHRHTHTLIILNGKPQPKFQTFRKKQTPNMFHLNLVTQGENLGERERVEERERKS